MIELTELDGKRVWFNEGTIERVAESMSESGEKCTSLCVTAYDDAYYVKESVSHVITAIHDDAYRGPR